MTAKLNQVLAIIKGVKSRVYGDLSELHKANQKPALFNGFSKEFTPLNDDGEKLPAERQRVQFVASENLRATERMMTELMDVEARRDWTNCVAKGSITLDDVVVLADVPASYLLFLEKQLSDLYAIVKALPVLDEADDWKKDENTNLYKTGVITTHRTKKVQKPIVLIQPTAEHPGQAVMTTEDVISGYWELTKMSGAIPRSLGLKIMERVEKMSQAVKEARERANMTDVVQSPKIGASIFGYILEGV